MKIIRLFVSFTLVLMALPVCAQVELTAGSLTLSVDSKARITSLRESSSGKDFLYKDTTADLLTLISSGKRFGAGSMVYNKARKLMSLNYPETNVSIDISIKETKGYLALEIVKAEPSASVEAVVWGPIPLNINDTVGEVIGVVRNQSIAFGMTVLNVKTLGGSYRTSEGMADGRGEAALSRPWGAVVQAYSINRNVSRRVDAWNGSFKNMPVPIIPGETVKGSRIALWGSPASQGLSRIESIVLDEKLPYPTINKQWLRRSPVFGRSYLISSFNEQQVDSMITSTKRAGLISLYHEGPFLTWGHYTPTPEFFPTGEEGVKKAAAKAKAAGLFFGVHTLTNFINTDDRYVTPVPDPRLAKTGSSTLVKAISDTSTSIAVKSPEYFSNEQSNWLHTVMIGQELIRYQSVTSSVPYTLLNCQRGAFGTSASAHSANDSVGKLLDHPYMVFFPNFELQKEITARLVSLFNSTGISHWDFDGHEGGLATGEGDYGVEMFAKQVTDNIDHDYLVGTSNSRTFYWNSGSYYNWGEPWYGGFKESMEGYRISNQAFFDRNYMPRMLGWYLMSEYTSMADMEWMLARAAGYGAGFAMVARPEALRTNPIAGELLDAIREWEEARNSHSFSVAQKERMKDPKNEFQLNRIDADHWSLSQVIFSPSYPYEKFIRQPGEPTYGKWTIDQQAEAQPLKVRIKANGEEGLVRSLKLVVDNSMEIVFPGELNAGETLIADGSKSVIILDKTGKRRTSFQLSKEVPVLASGQHTITIDGRFEGSRTPVLDVQFRFTGPAEQVLRRK